MSKEFSIFAASLETSNEKSRKAAYPPRHRRVCWSLSILAAIALLLTLGCESNSALEGSVAPSFTLASASNTEISLDQLLADKKATVIVFYRGFF